MTKIEAVDLFCGIGGLTHGLINAGINVLAGLDNDKSCAASYENNNKSKFITADIAEYDFNDMKSLYSRDSTRILVGCAPCQPFSSHSFKSKNKESDERWGLIDYFLKAVDVLEPDIISMENVRGITRTDIFKDFVEALRQRDYHIDYKIVYCPEYGIPQNRSRLVLLGSKLGQINVPEKTHEKKDYVNIRDIIKDLPALKAGDICESDPVHRVPKLSPLNIKRIKQSKPRGSWKDWDETLLPDCYRRQSGQTYTSVYGRMAWDEPSSTITTQFFCYGSGRFGHPTQDRALSMREGALLQTFPMDYDFGEITSTVTLGRQIGNAVPPDLAFIIGQAITEHVKEYV